MRVTIIRNIETFPSKQMYPYISLVERKVAEFFHYVDRKKALFGLVKLTYFHHFFQTIAGVLVKLFEKVKSQIHLKYRKLVTNVKWRRSLHRFSIMQRIYNTLEYQFPEKIRGHFCKRYKQYFELAWYKKPCHAFNFLLNPIQSGGA